MAKRIKCNKHPTYKVLHKPRARCVKCWQLYYWNLQKKFEKADKTHRDSCEIMIALLGPMDKARKMIFRVQIPRKRKK